MKILVERIYSFQCFVKGAHVAVRVWSERGMSRDEKKSVVQFVSEMPMRGASITMLKAFDANAVEVTCHGVGFVVYKDWP